jgi:hypothetical protein
MSDGGWIICEHSGRWAAALRLLLARHADNTGFSTSLSEVRSLKELSARLDTSSHAVALIEVRRTQLHEVLTWLADARPAYFQARFIALLHSAEFDKPEHDAVVSSLFAAGVADISDSPRRLRQLLPIVLRHAASKASHASHPAQGQEFAEWAWGLLPWQEAKRRIG